MPGLWMNDDAIEGGKYLVIRRDGTQPEWPYFVIGARDPAAPAALMEYARAAERLGMDPDYVRDVRKLADDFESHRYEFGDGDPEAPPHRKDDPAVVARMVEGNPA